jgi:hypothetical protein
MGTWYKIAALAATLGCAAGIPVWGQPHLDDLFRTKPWALAQSTYHRVLGYRHPAVKTFMPGGSTEPVYAPYTEHYPPDTQAARLVADQPPVDGATGRKSATPGRSSNASSR